MIRLVLALGFAAAIPLACAAAPQLKVSPPPLRIEEAVKPGAAVQKRIEEARAAFAKGELERAKRGFQAALDASPENLTALVNLGVIEFRLDHASEAAKLLKKAIRLNPEIAPAWLTLAMCQQRNGETDAALASAAQAVALDPKNSRAHAALAVPLVTKGWFSGAEAELQRAIELDPEFGEANFNLALLYLQRTPPAIELARRHYQRALDLGESPDPSIAEKLAATPPQ
jgi:tetratricopeptide (TPR) repeat protein